MRGRAELRSGANILTANEALEALTSNRNFGSTVITLQEQFDSATVGKLKKFHHEFFNVTNPATDAKDAAMEFQKKVRAEATELEVLASHAGTYPFMASLTPLATELKTLADREWAHCLKNLAEFSEKLLDNKETVIDPLKQFYTGPKRAIYDDIVKFLRDESANLSDVPGTDASDLRETIASASPYKSNTLQQAKVKLDSSRTKVAQVVTTAREQACTQIEQARVRPKGMPEFSGLLPEEQNEILRPFDDALAQVQKERLAPVIRQLADRATNEVLPRQLQRLAEIVTAKEPPKMKDGPKEAPIQYIAARSIQVSFAKPVLETEQDLADYLTAVKAAYSAKLKQNNRITL